MAVKALPIAEAITLNGNAKFMESEPVPHRWLLIKWSAMVLNRTYAKNRSFPNTRMNFYEAILCL